MARTDLDICNSALIICGADEIVSFDQGDFSAKIVSSLYSDAKGFLLTSNEWTFAEGQSEPLNLLTSSPQFDWQYAYRLPSNCLSVISVYPNMQYDVVGDKIYTNFKGEVFVNMKFIPPEESWPPYFVHYFVLYFASVICLPITEDATKTKGLADQAVVAGRVARNTDAKQRKNRGFKRFPLISVRG
jgi:hypothetical protein